MHITACEQGALHETHLDTENRSNWLSLAARVQAQGPVCCLLEAKQGYVASAECFLTPHVSAATSFAGPWRTGNTSPRPRQPQVSAACPARQLRRLTWQLCSLHVHLHHTLASGGFSLVRRFPYMLFSSPLFVDTNPPPGGTNREVHLTAVPIGRLFGDGQACRRKEPVHRCEVLIRTSPPSEQG